jgi:hypothetical protein
MIPGLSWSQISISGTSAITQNFDSLGTSGTATLPAGWKMSAAGAGTSAGYSTSGNLTAVNLQASSGSPATGGRYNWGSSSSERALGFMTSGSYASPNAIMVLSRIRPEAPSPASASPLTTNDIESTQPLLQLRFRGPPTDPPGQAIQRVSPGHLAQGTVLIPFHPAQRSVNYFL